MPKTTVTSVNGQLSELTCWPDRLRALRLGKGFSQAELARQAGVSRQAICDIEKSRRNPSYRTAARIAARLDVQLSAFCRVHAVYQEDKHVA